MAPFLDAQEPGPGVFKFIRDDGKIFWGDTEEEHADTARKNGLGKDLGVHVGANQVEIDDAGWVLVTKKSGVLVYDSSQSCKIKGDAARARLNTVVVWRSHTKTNVTGR